MDGQSEVEGRGGGMIWIKRGDTWIQRDDYYPEEDCDLYRWLTLPLAKFIDSKPRYDEDGNVVLEARLEDGVWTC